MSTMQIIEINGIKMEVDLRQARRIDTFQIGTKVKVLLRSDYAEPTVRSGVIVGFEPFEELPTITVCYLDIGYSEAKICFAYINSSPKSRAKYEIIAAIDDDLPIQKENVLALMERDEQKKLDELNELRRKREYFLQHFKSYFVPEKV